MATCTTCGAPPTTSLSAAHGECRTCADYRRRNKGQPRPEPLIIRARMQALDEQGCTLCGTTSKNYFYRTVDGIDHQLCKRCAETTKETCGLCHRKELKTGGKVVAGKWVCRRCLRAL